MKIEKEYSQNPNDPVVCPVAFLCPILTVNGKRQQPRSKKGWRTEAQNECLSLCTAQPSEAAEVSAKGESGMVNRGESD